MALFVSCRRQGRREFIAGGKGVKREEGDEEFISNSKDAGRIPTGGHIAVA